MFMLVNKDMSMTRQQSTYKRKATTGTQLNGQGSKKGIECCGKGVGIKITYTSWTSCAREEKWEFESYKVSWQPAVHQLNYRATTQAIQCNFLALRAFPVQHRFQSAPWNREMLRDVTTDAIKVQKYWNPHENSFGLFPSFHEVSVEKAPITAHRADSLLPAGVCLDSPDHSKYKL